MRPQKNTSDYLHSGRRRRFEVLVMFFLFLFFFKYFDSRFFMSGGGAHDIYILTPVYYFRRVVDGPGSYIE